MSTGPGPAPAVPVLVVGAGPTGLGVATELASAGPVVLIDRVPVTGGSAGWGNPAVRGFTTAASENGVVLRLGESAIRWDGRQLLIAAPGRFDRVAGRHLFVAGGLRPATLANLRVTGDRPAGVLAATVAEHLLQAGVRLWKTVVVVGEGPWAQVVADRSRKVGTRVIALTAAASAAAAAAATSIDWADERLDQPEQWSVLGRDRVCGIRLRTDSGPVDVACDAVVLAADPVPNRNIDGAVLPDSPGVTFVQPVTPTEPAARYTAARATARAWLRARERPLE